MTWFAIRTVPGSQKPQREFVVEETGSAKGYRIVPSLNANQSAVERALEQAGYAHYMPSEKRLVRDRRHTDLFKSRRFALIVGYVFIKGPCDLHQIRKVPGVLDIVAIRGKPMEIDLLDILTLRSMEAIADAQFDRDAANARKNLIKKSRNNPFLRKLAAKLEAAQALTLPFGQAA